MFNEQEAVMEASFYYHLFARASYASYRKTGRHLAFNQNLYRQLLHERFAPHDVRLILHHIEQLVSATKEYRQNHAPL